ncbi:MAG: hypothetical protein IKW58_02480 [Alphaproteobacteria bacterium]|nr:hypothetical protein [Alphaproteobacteria bacterium]
MDKFEKIFSLLKRLKKSILLFGCILLLSACDKCLTFQDYKSEGLGAGCALCPLFKVLTASATQAANGSWVRFADPLKDVILVTTAIFIAFNTLKMVGAFGKRDFADFMTNDKKGALILGFKAGVIFLLLSDTFLIDTVLVPVLESGLIIGQTLSTNVVNISWGSASSGWASLFDMVNKAALELNNQVYENIALGSAMICRSTQGFILSWYWLMLLYGFIFFIFGWFLLACISFFIVDIMVNLTIGAILLPFAVAFAISNQTMGYTKKVWQIFLGVFFNFLMLGVILGVSVQLIELGMGKLESDMSPATGLDSFLGNISMLLDNDNVKKVSEILWEKGCLLLTIVSFWLASQLIDQVKELAANISDAIGAKGVTNPGTDAAKPYINKAVVAGKSVGKYAFNTGVNGVKYTGHVASRITRLDKGMAALSRGATSLRGKLTGTGRDGYKAWWRK